MPRTVSLPMPVISRVLLTVAGAAESKLTRVRCPTTPRIGAAWAGAIAAPRAVAMSAIFSVLTRRCGGAFFSAMT